MADPFPKKVDDILKKKLNAIDNADAKFIEGFSNIEKTIYNAVRERILKMNIEQGKAIFDDDNVQIINELNDVIADAIASSGYPAKVKEYLRSFDTIKQFNFDAHQDVNDLSQKELEKLINPMQKQVVQQTIDGLTGSGIDTQFIQPMKEGIFKNIVGGASITDLESYLKQFILSDELRLGQFKKYTTQIARDTLNQFDGQVNSRIAGEYGLNAYKYTGSLIDDSRPQCVRWVNKGTLLLDDLPNEISWAYNNGSGMIPGTTSENFAVFRGGYNCRHSAIPFKMTKSQMEKYNGTQEQIDAEPIETKDEKQVEPLSMAQRDLKLTFGQSSLTPDVLKPYNVPDQLFILSDNSNPETIDSDDAFYDSINKKVTLDLNNKNKRTSNVYKSNVIIHEYNHRIHFEKKLIDNRTNITPENEKTFKAFEKSKQLFIEKIGEKRYFEMKSNGIPYDVFDEWKWINNVSKKYFGKIDGFTNDDIIEFTEQYLDTIAGLTDGFLGIGHETDYWKQTNAGKAEWFAHASENYWFGNPVFKAEFPELYDQMNEYYKKNVVDVYLKDYLK